MKEKSTLNNMTWINCYLALGGSCRQAMTFYKECYGGALSLQTVAGSLVAGQYPDFMQDRILHAKLTNGDLTILGFDPD